MSFALKELSRLLATERPLVGSVVAVEANVVRIATERGAITARALDTLTVGDRAQVQNGIAARAPIARQAFPV